MPRARLARSWEGPGMIGEGKIVIRIHCMKYFQ